jgi:nucleoid DNA-binding protein
MLKKRKLKLIHYVILVVILAVTIWTNIRLYFINSAVCSASSAGVCTDLVPYTIAEYLAYISLLLLGIYIIYMYFISIGKKQTEETIICISEFEDINDQRETTLFHEKITTDHVIYTTNTETIENKDSVFVEDELNDDIEDEINIIEEIEEQIVTPTKRKTKSSKPKDNTVYKKEIVANIVRTTNLSTYKAMKSLNILIDEISQRLLDDETVGIEGLGTFKKYKVEDYKTINPLTQEEILVEEHHRIRYKPDVLFMQSMNNSANSTVKAEVTEEKQEIIPVQKKKKVVKPKDNTVYKKEIVANIMKSTELSSYKAMKSLNILIDEISETLLKGEKVSIEGLGSFKKYKVEDYKTVNPLTKEEILVEEHHRIRYKPDTIFMQSLNDSSSSIAKEEKTSIKPVEAVSKVEVSQQEINPVPRKKKVVKPKDNSVYKKEIAENIAKQTGLSKYKAMKSLNVLVEEISNTLLSGETVNIDGLGSFKKYKVDEYKAVNPITKEEIIVEEHHRIRYKPDKAFKECINKK